MISLLCATAACGSDSSNTSDAEPPPVDLRQLEVGPYAVTPRKIDTATNMPVARYMEAERLGNILPLPTEIDPALKYGDSGQTHAFLDATPDYHLSPMFRWLREEDFGNAAKNFVAGFSTTGNSNEKQSLSYELVSSVLIFTDDDSAKAAAEALSRTGYYDEEAEPASLAKYPDAFARRQPKNKALFAWLARGKFVVVTITQHHENKVLDISEPEFLSALAEKSIAATLPTLEKFVPTPPDKLMSVPIDPDNMRGRSLRRPEGDSFENIPGTYDRHGALQFADDIDETRRLYDEAGVDRVAFDGGELVRTKDPAAAQKLFEKTSEPDRFSRPAAAPKGLPNARCREYKGPSWGYLRFYCQVRYDRFVAKVASNQLQDTQQRISAQYSILADSK
ncbi:DUF7373 family lipoprotein [Nocardia blacklockiae]|uniref:DUF7373 family lipoprotein n=1 Tax=Nocardia blacklockiae TaxID=480036 RepID=UPI0018937E9D|nr:hypothetical protein [Nocardia blacklockiae]MBF6171356.1 hypothetical protein [Nocardia blacklockiae]